MVEEHATNNITCRIEVECPTSGSTTAATTPGCIPANPEDKPSTEVKVNDAEGSSSENSRSPSSPKPGCSGQNSQQTDVPSGSDNSPPPPAPTIIRGDNGSGGSNGSGEINQNEEEQQVIKTLNLVPNPTLVARRLKQENERLQAELTRLRRLVITAGAAAAHKAANNDAGGSCPEDGKPEGSSPGVDIELQLAREALTALRADRKRLKAEKFDLLNQMKQLYATLEDKEKELRDFIRNYEQRIRESDASLQQLSTEREERERERWSLLRHARDEAERSLSLAAQLNAKELQLRESRDQLREARRQLGQQCCLSDQEQRSSVGCPPTPGSLGPPGDRGSCSADSGVVRGSETASACGNLSDSTTDGTPTITVDASGNPIVDADSISVVSSAAGQSHHMYQIGSTPKDCSPTLSPLNANNFSRSMDTGILSRSVEQLSSPLDPEPSTLLTRRKPPSRPRGGGTWGSISRVFARSRHRTKTSSAGSTASDGPLDADGYRSWSPLTEEGYAEKLRLLREASSVPMERWRAPTVLAWLEIALGMPQYGPRCAENVKSGKVLLELSDVELECGLGIIHPMHRKKLRLAIEEHRHPSLVRYPCIAQLGHTWVSSEWLPDLGLAQYSENFATNMVDARMLEHLSKKELEKCLGVTRKFHQASIVHGIHLLRIMKYDRQALAVRRHQCETVDADPLVWSNQRFIRWARNIDLSEYADNLKDSGVHGALVVLEPSFNGDTMATALGIPQSKNIIRRHLTAELEALVLPARSTLGARPAHRSSASIAAGTAHRTINIWEPAAVGAELRRLDYRGIRGSLSRALGLSSKSDRDKQSPTSSSETSSIVSRMSPTSHQPSGGESPIYAQPFGYADRSTDRTDRHSTHSEGKYGYGIHRRSQRVSLFGHLANVTTGSLPRFKHRRVRSIGDIDNVKPVSSPV